MISNIVSPFLTASTAPASAPSARPAAAEQPAAAPADVVTTSGAAAAAEAPASDGAKLSVAKRAGVGLMAGVALLGAGLLAPTAASAQPMRGYYGHSQVYHPAPVYRGGYGYGGGYGWGHHGGGNVGGAIVGGIIGGIIGGAIINQTMPPPVIVTPGYPAPMPQYDPGYNGYGCDGVYHHFDSYGNVTDASGHYRLQQNQWGQCFRTPAQPY